METRSRAELVNELLLELQRSTLWTVLLHQATAKKAGMNITDAVCLSSLVLDGPQSPGKLARLMGITAGGAIRSVVERLERAGFVERLPDPRGDRRRIIVCPVPEHLAHFRAYLEPVTASIAHSTASTEAPQLAFLVDWVRQQNADLPSVIEEIRSS